MTGRRVLEVPPRERGMLHAIGVGLSAGLLVLVLGLAVVTILLPLAVGGRPLTVLTQSMEPGLPPGTLIIVKPEPVGEIRLGDVVTYQIESGEPGVVSHRVVEKTFATDGSTTFRTKGDNNDAVDEQPVREVQIVGVLWYSVPLLGWVNTAVNGEARALIVPIVVVALFGYAAWAFASALLTRRRTRRAHRARLGHGHGHGSALVEARPQEFARASDRGSPLRLRGRGEQPRQHRHHEEHVVGRHLRPHPTGRLLAGDDLADDAQHPLAQMVDPVVVPLGADHVDHRRRDQRLGHDAVEQRLDGGLRMRGQRLELGDVLVEDRDRERHPIGEVAVEAALPDAGATSH
ncbi:signal peptidase I [Herbiconiux flava]|uniref:Signal peptidase I n=1 Tax=Herbiconiux flava TaxID=881268 RepID=A0A852SMP8_9MICO|nr:signal peptidase I [Herbiconiux flava]NYD70091.1 signal peptidase I [Herbiconiux flava]GLK16842.1 hypothetical protein GCM10017602_13240 [Herbiconiux flava]